MGKYIKYKILHKVMNKMCGYCRKELKSYNLREGRAMMDKHIKCVDWSLFRKAIKNYGIR